MKCEGNNCNKTASFRSHMRGKPQLFCETCYLIERDGLMHEQVLSVISKARGNKKVVKNALRRLEDFKSRTRRADIKYLDK